MKETTRASIGGFAFNIDTDAHAVLAQYLDQLSSYYQGKEDGSEIISDIEARMSELLQMKLTYPDRIVTLTDAEEIISTMGQPHELFSEDYEKAKGIPENKTSPKISSAGPKEDDPKWRKKRLYRDVDNKVLSGVCSGLGHYFRIDPVLVRIGFVVLLFLTNLIDPGWSLFAVALYFILLIAMPKAETMSDKIVMTRTNPTIEGIANRENLGQTAKRRGSSIVRVLGAIIRGVIGGVSLLCGISILIATIGVVIGLFVETTITSRLIYVLPYLGFGITEISTPLLVFLFTLSIMFIHFGIKILLSKFKMRDFIILSIAAVVCVTSLVYLFIAIKSEADNYRKSAVETEQAATLDSIQTLHIALSPEYRDYSTVLYAMSWYRNDENNQWFSAPSVVLINDTNQIKTEILIEKKFYAKSKQQARMLAKNEQLRYTIKADSLLLSPTWRGENLQWNRNIVKILVKPARGVKVTVEEPLKVYNTDDYRMDKEIGQPFYKEDFTFSIQDFD